MALSLTLLVGLMVLSPTYVGFMFEMAGYSERAKALAREYAVGSDAFHPGALATFASPYLPVLKLSNAKLWPYTDVSTCSIYLGVAVWMLALLALLWRPRDRWRWWIAGLILLNLGFALGRTLPLRGWLYDWLAPARYFRHAGMFRGYALFAVAVLALLATRDLDAARQHPEDKIWKRFMGASGLLAASAIITYFFVIRNLNPAGLYLQRMGQIHLVWIWLGGCAVAWAGWKLRGGRWAWLFPILLLMLAAGDARLTRIIAQPLMYGVSNQILERWQQIDRMRSSSLDLRANGLVRAERSLGRFNNLDNKNLPMKIPILESYSAFSNRFYEDIARRPILRALALGPQRIGFSARAAEVELTDTCYQAFIQQTERLGAPPLVLHSRAAILQMPGPGESRPDDARNRAAIAQLPAIAAVAIELIKYQPEELAFRVECPGDGWLLVTDRWARGWRATVNGTATEVRGGNFFFRAVPVRRGWNEIQFTYRPFGYPGLLMASWGTMVLVLAWSVGSVWLPRRRKTASTGLAKSDHYARRATVSQEK